MGKCGVVGGVLQENEARIFNSFSTGAIFGCQANPPNYRFGSGGVLSVWAAGNGKAVTAAYRFGKDGKPTLFEGSGKYFIVFPTHPYDDRKITIGFEVYNIDVVGGCGFSFVY